MAERGRPAEGASAEPQNDTRIMYCAVDNVRHSKQNSGDEGYRLPLLYQLICIYASVYLFFD